MNDLTLEQMYQKVDDSQLFRNNVATEDRVECAKMFVQLAWYAGQRAAIKEQLELMQNIKP